MTPKEFNAFTKTILKDRLSTFGFKNQKEIFYLHKSPNILALVRHYYRDQFLGFYIVVTNDFIGNTKDELGGLKLSSFLEDYPFSISIDDLESQYQKFDSVLDFEYDTNFMTRAVLPTRTKSKTFSIYDKIRHDEKLVIREVNSVADKTIKFGLRLMNEYSPAVSYQSVTRHKKAKDHILEMFKAEIEQYCLNNNIALPKQKKNWFSFFK